MSLIPRKSHSPCFLDSSKAFSSLSPAICTIHFSIHLHEFVKTHLSFGNFKQVFYFSSTSLPKMAVLVLLERQQETEARRGFCPRDWPGDGGREQLSLPPSCFDLPWSLQSSHPKVSGHFVVLLHRSLLTCPTNVFFMFSDKKPSSKHCSSSSLLSALPLVHCRQTHSL